MRVRSVLVLLAATVLVAVSGGCGVTISNGAPPTAPPPTSAGADQATPSKAPPRYAPPVREPKDARGVAVCDLLTDAQLTELGLLADTARSVDGANAQNCSWSSATDAADPAGVQLRTENGVAPLDFIYVLRDQLVNFTELEVAGHPALRGDYNDNGTCTIYTAIADYQGIGVSGSATDRSLPDPCALAIRMTELILSNLPPLTEE